MGFVEQLVGLIGEGSQPALEHILSALQALVTDHAPSLNECRQPYLHLRSTLLNLLEQSRGLEERQVQLTFVNINLDIKADVLTSYL
jgi:hypothetical protein